MSEERFTTIVEEDIARIGTWVAAQSDSLRTKLGMVLLHCTDSTYAVDYLREQCDAIGRTACELDKLILLNYEAFLKAAKKHDKWIGLSTRPWMLTRLSTAVFFHERFDKVVSGLSDAYAILRAREHPVGKVVWEPPSEFNRCTTKYWVKPEDVLAVKLALIKQIPVLIFGRATGSAGPANQPSDSSLITSVYLDNDSLDVYNSRLDRLAGATLYRLRWYGPRTGPDQHVYVERKTHRGAEDKKAGLLSVKERFRVRWSDIGHLLAGTMDLKLCVEDPLRADGEKEEGVTYAVNLAHQCQQEIALRRLQPISTIVYYRTSFQLSSSNTVRSTLDCQLRMVDETSTRGSLAPDEWYRPLQDELNKDIHEFPYSVLEIKLQGDTPEWVTELTNSGKISKCYKFSKYLVRCAALQTPCTAPNRTNSPPSISTQWSSSDIPSPKLPTGSTSRASTFCCRSGAPAAAAPAAPPPPPCLWTGDQARPPCLEAPARPPWRAA